MTEQQSGQISGFLLVDKPSGWTSHDVVAVARGRLKVRRIGHAGTLDPAATGLLVLLVGAATKKQSEFQQGGKVYSGVMALGAETDTWDADGRITASYPTGGLDPAAVSASLTAMQGTVKQTVPPYSAVKVNGTPLYRLARRGEVVAPVEKTVNIYKWRDVSVRLPEVMFTVECGGGTYVRSLAWMLGRELGCGGHLKSLRRLKVGEFAVEDALPGADLKTMPREAITARLLQL
ncbi:MAG: tRNA pseudouridine(55) synthase TruB [Elusimicrobiaceae bacterium]|nr:tRNA pseudouridine(55) synthase TruB [Elusimicrobiaceae bacterium]